MHKTIYKFQCKLQLKQREESPRMQWKATELFKKQWVDNKLINLVEVILPRITHTTKATNQEMDQTAQLQESILTKEEFIAQVDQSAVPQDQVPEQEPMVESQVPKTFSVWSSAHASQIFKMSKTPEET